MLGKLAVGPLSNHVGFARKRGGRKGEATQILRKILSVAFAPIMPGKLAAGPLSNHVGFARKRGGRKRVNTPILRKILSVAFAQIMPESSVLGGRCIRAAYVPKKGKIRMALLGSRPLEASYAAHTHSILESFQNWGDARRRLATSSTCG
jgi:hypothetical protein